MCTLGRHTETLMTYCEKKKTSGVYIIVLHVLAITANFRQILHKKVHRKVNTEDGAPLPPFGYRPAGMYTVVHTLADTVFVLKPVHV